MFVSQAILCLVLGLFSSGYNPIFAFAVSADQIVQDLQSRLSSASNIIHTSDGVHTTQYTPRYSISDPPTYQVSVRPALVDDVQKTVNYISQNNLSFLATGRGHGYSTSLGRLRGGIDIDLGAFNGISIDPAAQTVTVGGSVRAGDVAAALQEAGLELPVPQCPCVGLAGASLGGGIGPYSSLYGPISDSLLSVEMITGSGELLNVSQTQNLDLFYALKGAGFNYGIVTSASYRVYPATNAGQVMNADMIFSGSQNGTIWELVNSFVASQPKELSIGLGIAYSPAGGVLITANFIYAGSQEAGTTLIQPFLDMNPQNLNISSVPWKDIPAAADYGAIAQYGCTPGIYYAPNAINLYQVDVDNLVTVTNYLNSTLASNPNLANGFRLVWQQFSPHGFQLQALDSSAFPYRDAIAFVQLDGISQSASDLPLLDSYGQEIRDMLQNGSGKADLEVYVHFARGDEVPSSWYTAAKLPGLLALKKTYDPSNYFSWYNPLSGV